MEKEAGGAAFPLPHGAETIAGAEGMTLRDYFAAKIMQAFMTTQAKYLSTDLEVAKCAYAMADAMLEARK
jgi:hypothetical protein